MSIKDIGLEKGEWIVHPKHGVGQITSLEKKTVGGENQPYIHVEGSKYDWWIAIDQIKDTPIRPLRKPATFKRALRLLRDSPEDLPSGHKDRRRYIRGVLSSGSPAALCRVIRDLSALNRERGLPDEDRRHLNKYRDALVQEWRLTLDVSESKAVEQLNDYLAEGWADANDE
ncbi:MAG: CarD family transcriptional regulator [Anaerolineales bacterium]|jgi:CarD family transcriptional regulator